MRPTNVWLRAGLFGLFAGALLSVLWFEVALFTFCALVFYACRKAWLERRWGPLLVQVLVGWTVMDWAADAPYKFIDRPMEDPLPSRVLTVQELCRALQHRPCEPREGDEERGFTKTVVLPSLRPSYREVDTALAELGLELKLGYCGNGGSILRGMFPLHLREIVRRKPRHEPQLRLAARQISWSPRGPGSEGKGDAASNAGGMRAHARCRVDLGALPASFRG